MKTRWLLLCGLTATITLSTPILASDSGTRELRREVMKLHSDIQQSAAELLLLAETDSLAPVLAKSDNVTVLAALETLRNRSYTDSSASLAITDEGIAAARHKIEIYKMLCASARENQHLFTKYCDAPPYARLYESYRELVAKYSDN